MGIYTIKGENLEEIKEEIFDLERDIQKLTEVNLKKIFNLELLKGATKQGEFSLNGLRIDSLAFDNETKSFVVIEYKKDKNISVIDQGYAYLSLLLNNKAEFILEYNGTSKNPLRREDVDWSQSKVIFISPIFTTYQKQAINFRDLPIELWEVKKFSNNTILYNQLTSPETSESITKVSQQSAVVREVNKEVKVFTEEDHLRAMPENVTSMYQELKERILTFGDDIKIVPKQNYIAFKKATNFVDIGLTKSKGIWIQINLKKGELDDPKKLAKDYSEKGHWGNGDYAIIANDLKDSKYILELIKQSYDKN
jgi:predicted transport protein